MNRHEAAYRKEWATLTGKSEREIYVPFALRDKCVECASTEITWVNYQGQPFCEPHANGGQE